jgi:cytochrome c peroxidase
MKLTNSTPRQIDSRNAPSLLRLAGTSFYSDGRKSSLEDAVLHALTNPSEMGLASETLLIRSVRQNPFYRVAFRQAYRYAPTSPQLSQVADALAVFVRSLNDGHNRYDAFIAGNEQALSLDAQRGLSLFAGPAGCAKCHLLTGLPAPFTDSAFHSAAWPVAGTQLVASAMATLSQLGTSPAAIDALLKSDSALSNLGRYIVTRDPADVGAFRTPSLRNVALTAPYMHDGSVATISQAVDIELRTRASTAAGRDRWSERDKLDLLAFLDALTDLPSGDAATDPFETFRLLF